MDNSKGRILGIGGIFFKSNDPKKDKAWYEDNLGLNANDYGVTFEYKNANDDSRQYLQWSPFSENTDYFEPSSNEFMINYVVDDLDAFLVKLADKGIHPVGDIMRESYGNFAHIIDGNGRKIELWEKIDPAFTDTAVINTHK